MKEFLVTSQVARLIGRTPESVRSMERSGRLRAIRAGHVRLFSRRDVECLLRKREERDRAKAVAAAGR